MQDAWKVRRTRATSEDFQASTETRWGRKCRIPLKMGTEMLQTAPGTRWVFIFTQDLRQGLAITPATGVEKGQIPHALLCNHSLERGNACTGYFLLHTGQLKAGK
jgi:hypothetical protein